MANNPLHQYFRQPKVFIRLPSAGVYSRPGTYTQDVNNMPVYGMTGMDEIILKTPDALLSGESVVRVIQSCIPGISNAWDMSVLDTDVIFAAIRIATYGNEMSVSHKCTECETDNEYDLDLGRIIEHFSRCKYDNRVIVGDLVIKTQPLTYRQATNLNIRNYEMQQRLAQILKLEAEQQQPLVNALYEELAASQNDMYRMSIESVEVGSQLVTDPNHIDEWLRNCDRNIYESVKSQINRNREVWTSPLFPVKCESCGAEAKLFVNLDQSNFFDQA